MGVTCHPTEMRESRLYPQPKQVLDLATQEGCKAELTYVTWKRTGRDLLVASPTRYRWATTHVARCFGRMLLLLLSCWLIVFLFMSSPSQNVLIINYKWCLQIHTNSSHFRMELQIEINFSSSLSAFLWMFLLSSGR